GNDEDPTNFKIGRAAEDFVEFEERSSGRIVQRMNPNNKGFDIRSEGAAGGDIRIIEVKGLSGEWEIDGVPLSAAQFALAWKERETYWLYVVEYALDASRRRLTKIPDPVSRITQYRFDNGWRKLFGSDVLTR